MYFISSLESFLSCFWLRKVFIVIKNSEKLLFLKEDFAEEMNARGKSSPML